MLPTSIKNYLESLPTPLPRRVAITEDLTTGEIVGISTSTNQCFVSMGVQTLSPDTRGLVTWVDIEGKPHWKSQGKSTSKKYRSKWIDPKELLEKKVA
jgi:hypothetical protein